MTNKTLEYKKIRQTVSVSVYELGTTLGGVREWVNHMIDMYGANATFLYFGDDIWDDDTWDEKSFAVEYYRVETEDEYKKRMVLEQKQKEKRKRIERIKEQKERALLKKLKKKYDNV